MHVAAWQTPPTQTLSTQSEPTLQFLPSAHGAHALPPQSVSVSVPSFAPSEQLAGSQFPFPSQTPTGQSVPFINGTLLHL